MDKELEGHIEQLRGLRDRSGRLLFADGVQDDQALAGHNLFLTIDQGIQYVAERELALAAQTFEASGGSVIVVDPFTGEILAMASWPGYNPNDYRYNAHSHIYPYGDGHAHNHRDSDPHPDGYRYNAHIHVHPHGDDHAHPYGDDHTHGHSRQP